MLRRWLPTTEKGQNLVELVIVTPLLIFLMIGVFEVGWVLRGYLVLVNVNREITRFSVRPGYLDFSSSDSITESWDRVRGWVDTSLSGQLPLDFDETLDDTNPNIGIGNATLIISHLVADTGFPCRDINDSDCDDCTAFQVPSHNPFPQDDVIVHPGIEKFEEDQSRRYGPEETITGRRDTRIDYDEMIEKLIAQNNEFNCQILKRGGVPSANNVIVTELYYDQPQLFGFPFVSNPFTDPVLLYTHTTMRLVGAARSTGSSDGNLLSGVSTIGPLCLTYPFLADGTASGFTSGQPIDIIAKGWLKWNQAATGDEQYLSDMLEFPQMSISDFDDATGATETLQVNSNVAKIDVASSPYKVRDAVEGLVGQTIVIPYSNSPNGSPVTINGFKWATISDIEPDENSNPGTDEVTAVIASISHTIPLPEACK